MRIETERLYLREMTAADYEALYAVLADSDIMQHYPYTFDEARVRGWIDRNIERYSVFGFGLWAVCLHENGEMIGRLRADYAANKRSDKAGDRLPYPQGHAAARVRKGIRFGGQGLGFLQYAVQCGLFIHESGEPAVMPHCGKLGLYPGRRVRRRGERAYKGVRHHTQ